MAVARAIHRLSVRARLARLRGPEKLRGIGRQPRLDSLARRGRTCDARFGRPRSNRRSKAGRNTKATAFRESPGISGAGFGRPIGTQTISFGSTTGGGQNGRAATSTNQWRFEDRAVVYEESSNISRTATSPTTWRPSIGIRPTRLARCTRPDNGRTMWHLVGHPPLAFLRNYLARGGFRDGIPGFIISAMNAYYVFLKFAKLWEAQQQAERLVPLNP